MKRLTIIDTFGFFFRSYYALPNLRNREGFPTGLLMGFATMIYGLQEEHEGEYLLFALDSKGKNFRHALDPSYKANRVEAPEDLQRQLPIAIEWIKKMGFTCCEAQGYEADDVIASAVRLAKAQGIKVRIVTHDKDLYQLIDDGRVVIYDPMKKVEIDAQGCLEKYGIPPSRMGEYLALVGDSADNIPGVKGIGPKGAKKLLDQFDSLHAIYEDLESVANPRVKAMLEEGKESAMLSLQLVRLDDTLELGDLARFELPDNPLLAIYSDLERYELRSIVSKIQPKAPIIPQQTLGFQAILLDDAKMLLHVIEGIDDEAIVAFDTETNGLDPRVANMVGFSFCVNAREAYYVPLAHHYLGVGAQIDLPSAKKALSLLFSHKIVGQNLKFDLAIVEHNFGLTCNAIYADTMVMAWLLEPESSHGLDALAKRFFNHEMIAFKSVVQKGEDFSSVTLERACEYAAEDAWMTLRLYHRLSELLEPHLLQEAHKVEFPFVITLQKMEKEGIGLSAAHFQTLLVQGDSAIERLKAEIFALCGAQFNLNSTQQLGVVLFESLGLKAGKKTKTGYSTDESVLQSLINDHPVIPKLLEYRELYKLKSTYIEPLLAYAQSKARVHTSFMQTGTSTGRLSSKEPNLQNIPVKSELGKAVRGGFIAKEGYRLVGVDYSQIELRLLAHFSQDAAMVEAFCHDRDIHRQTAAQLFGEAGADAKRSVAKSINFGLLYGMGPKKLSDTLGISTKEAKEYIEGYFKAFPTIKTFLTSIATFAKEHGYVETLLGRRRYFDFAHANGMQYAMYEREAINTLFQGSAADIIKLSMNKIMRECVHAEAKLLLQIHDELIFEVKASLASAYAQKIKTVMEQIYPLHVPLKVSVAIGENWGALKG